MPERRNITRIISWLTALILAVVLIVPPCGYYLISYNYAAGSLETEATITAGIITQIISANPGLWEYEQASLKDLLLHRTAEGEAYAEVRRIYNAEQRLIVEIAEELHYPVIVRSRPLYDSGVVVGMIQISRSLRPLLVRSAVIALVMIPLCVGVFLVLRHLPIRTIEEAEEALKQAKQRYQRIVEDLPDLVCRYKPDTTITFVNDAYAQFFGKTADELIGTSFLALVPRETHEYILQSIASLTRELPVISMEHEVRAHDGSVRWQHWRDRAFFDETGTMTEIQSIGQDITERKEMEEKLKTLSITDDLTGLYNRRGFYALAEQQMKMARRMKADMVILSADLDYLKEINDTQGHQKGDQ
ncbi:MAG TPA: PAS domain S-box protein, partial [Dissulfurispiraceae bacterium]|nr:PAS domain S-box protein [Dissulfurispiraceae bacterium]